MDLGLSLDFKSEKMDIGESFIEIENTVGAMGLEMGEMGLTNNPVLEILSLGSQTPN